MPFTPLTDVFGQKPKVALWRNLNYGQEQKTAIGDNISAFPDITKLGDLYKSYLTDQMESLLPGYSDLLKSGVSTAQQELTSASPLLRGEIPQDIQDLVRRNAAQGAISGGFAGSGMAGNLTARDFGLTSLDLMQQGAALANQGGNAAQRWSQLASGQVMNPSAFLTTPSQQAAFDMQNRLLRTQSLQNKYNIDAAPNPAAKGISDTIINLIGAYLSKGGNTNTAAQSYMPASTSYSMDQGDPYNYGAYPGYGPGVA